MKVLNHLDLAGTELRSAVIQNLASDPTNLGAGHIYYHTGNNEARLYNGSGFKKLLMDQVQAGEYAAGSIVNADINGSAAIALSKLATDPLARANHTGTQTASTISDFDTQVRTSRLDQMAAPTSNLSLNSQKITALADPTNAQDAATKAYVDAARSGLSVKDAVRVLADSNQSLGSQGSRTIDSISLADGDRVLLTGQTSGDENGIYEVQGDFSLVRSDDADANAEVTAGMFTFITEGSTYEDTGWVLTTDDPITVDTTSLAFTQFSGTGAITAGDGLTKSGATLDFVAADTSLDVQADDVAVNLNSSGGLEVSTGVRVKLDGASLTRGASGLKVTDGTYQGADGDLDALAALSSTGMLARTGSETYATRDITGTSNRIDVTNGDGVSGDPTIDISSSYVGQASITTLGTISTGTWNGDTIGIAYGGTGATTAAGARSNLGTTGSYTSATHGAGTTITIAAGTHGLGTGADKIVQVAEVSSEDVVYPDINVEDSTGDVTITFASSVGANSHRVTIIG